MDWIRILLKRSKALFSTKTLDEDLDAELRTRIEVGADGNVKHCLSREEVRRAELHEVGPATQIEQRYGTKRGLGWLDALAHSFTQLVANKNGQSRPVFPEQLTEGGFVTSAEPLDQIKCGCETGRTHL